MSCTHVGKGESRDFDRSYSESKKQFDGFNDDGTQKEVEILTTSTHYKVRCQGCGAELRDEAEFNSIRM